MDRRQWLRWMLSATAGIQLAPHVLAAGGAQPGKSIILVELAGANDGLNMVAPYGDDTYFRLRPNIALQADERITLDDHFALNAAMPKLARHFLDGEVTLVHNLGYPNQNQSHFRSIEIWERGGDGNSQPRQGWPVNTAQALLDQGRDAAGVFLGGTANVFHGGGGQFFGGNFNSIIRLIKNGGPLSDGGSGLLAQLRANRKQTKEKLLGVEEKLDGSVRANVSGGALGNQLADVLRLIGNGVDIPFYKVALGGFDTHVNQPNQHRNLLRDLDNALSDTYTHLKRMGRADDVMIMTYSEFGRRPRENGARGTDHGSAAPHFVFGGGLPGGHIGGPPRLNELSRGNLKFEIDYRRLYSHALGQHLGVQDHPFTQFKPLI